MQDKIAVIESTIGQIEGTVNMYRCLQNMVQFAILQAMVDQDSLGLFVLHRFYMEQLISLRDKIAATKSAGPHVPMSVNFDLDNALIEIDGILAMCPDVEVQAPVGSSG